MKIRRRKQSEVYFHGASILHFKFEFIIYYDLCIFVFIFQSFWPSIVMKKWLNIKPKVYEFSEDEIDTETESEDDGMIVFDHTNSFLDISVWLLNSFFFNFHLAYSLKDNTRHVGEDPAHGMRHCQTSGNISFERWHNLCMILSVINSLVIFFHLNFLFYRHASGQLSVKT